MAISDGEVKVRVNFEGGGNVGIAADKAAKAVGNVDAKAKQLDKSTKGVARSFGELGQRGLEGADKVKAGWEKLVGVAGFLGTAVGGIVAGIMELTKADFTDTIAKVKRLADETSRFAQGWADALNFSSQLPSKVKAAELATLQARLSTAQAEGNGQLAREIAAQIARVSSRNDAQGFRDDAKATREAARKAEANRLAAADRLYEAQTRLAEITEKLSQPMAPYYGGPGQTTASQQRDRDRLRLEGLGIISTLPGLNAAAAPTAIEEAWRDVVAAQEMAADEITRAGEAQAQAALRAPGSKGTSSRSGAAYGLEQNRLGTAALRELERELFEAAAAANDDDAEMGSDSQWFALEQQLSELTKLDTVRGLADDFNAWGESIGYVADQISQFSPELGAFAEASAQIKEIWADYADEQFNVANAVTQSFGAIAKAGAQQIKNERARAGLLALIELGLGIATSFVNPPEAKTHFAAAAVLGLAAAGVGGASGSAGARAERPRSRVLSSGEPMGGGNWTVNINAPFLASSQETARELMGLLEAA